MGRQIGHEISRCRKAPRICMFSVSYPGAHARIHIIDIDSAGPPSVAKPA